MTKKTIWQRLDIKFSQKGCYRNVLLIGKYAIKFPTLFNQQNFLYGCYCNVSERNYCKKRGEHVGFLYSVAPSLFCSFFGLIQVQYRCEEISSERFALLTQKTIDRYLEFSSDIKSANLGYYKGRLVIFDYA